MFVKCWLMTYALDMCARKRHAKGLGLIFVRVNASECACCACPSMPCDPHNLTHLHNCLHLNGIVTIAFDVREDKAQLLLLPFVLFDVMAAMKMLQVLREVSIRPRP